MTPTAARPDRDDDALAARKQALRAAAKAVRRQAAAADRAAGGRAAMALCALFLESGAATGDSIVSGYWPMGDEVDSRPLLEALAALGCRLVLPAMRGPDQPLDFRCWSPGDPLVAAGFGTREPAADRPVFDPQILLVPLLAFDAEGYRLGYGGGFYDRSLARLRSAGDVLAVGLAYADQQVESLPRDANDQKLDWLVTERALIRL